MYKMQKKYKENHGKYHTKNIYIFLDARKRRYSNISQKPNHQTHETTLYIKTIYQSFYLSTFSSLSLSINSQRIDNQIARCENRKEMPKQMKFSWYFKRLDFVFFCAAESVIIKIAGLWKPVQPGVFFLQFFFSFLTYYTLYIEDSVVYECIEYMAR